MIILYNLYVVVYWSSGVSRVLKCHLVFRRSDVMVFVDFGVFGVILARVSV